MPAVAARLAGAALPTVHPTVVHMLADSAARAGDRIALIDGGRRLAYRDYLACVAGFARELIDMGAAGERVALILGNSMDMAIAMFAVHAAGAQAVPVNPIYTARELKHILEDAAPVVVLHDPVVGPLLTDFDLQNRIEIGGDNGRNLDRWVGEAIDLPPPPNPDDLASLQYTGGTTGLPKGVIATHRQMATNISQREALLPTRTDGEHILCVMPLFHVFAVSMCLHLAAYCRGTLAILPRYHPETVLKALRGEGITVLPGGPTVFNGLMAHPDFASSQFPNLRICYSGSAPLPEETLRQWEAATGCAILEGYGQTEAGPVLTYNPEHGARKAGSVGVALPETEVQIVDVETGTRVLGAGEQGEIRARGPQVMTGYRNRPDATAAALRDGWLYTGDIGEFDRDGYLSIRDRKKDMAIVGGYNVYPREIDEVLHAHPDVLEAAAVGVPDDYRGEVIKAGVVLKAGARADAESVLAHCRDNLAKYKIPTAIEFVADLPKTPVGKIDKKAVKELLSGGGA
ncbi:MAG: long-chain fatty acid--CoA ligase [Minwuiales bacterium]|nr:long-chain fatty acid--CoA ligase [Minwuiales bacterium]